MHDVGQGCAVAAQTYYTLDGKQLNPAILHPSAYTVRHGYLNAQGNCLLIAVQRPEKHPFAIKK